MLINWSEKVSMAATGLISPSQKKIYKSVIVCVGSGLLSLLIPRLTFDRCQQIAKRVVTLIKAVPGKIINKTQAVFIQRKKGGIIPFVQFYKPQCICPGDCG